MKKSPFLVGLTLLGSLAATGASAQPQQPLRLVMNNELQILDPIMTPSVVTRAFASMVWDTLAAPDSQGVMQPQMLQGWEVSADRLTWTLTLRPGLEWSDGTPVAAEDCVASIRRWGARDGLGRQLIAATASMEVTGPNSFVIKLNRPFALVIEALGKAATLVPYMMPARIANTSPTSQITEIIGSGPFLFRREEWRSGDRVVFHRNPRYRPRSEPADGLAGGKVVHFERAEFVSIPDHSTKVAALQQGEIDYIERAPLDFIEILRRDRRVVVTPGRGPAEILGALTLNNTQPPFNDVRARRALQQAVNQADVVAATGLPADMVHQQCLTFFMCGTPYATDAGSEALRNRSSERARALLREAGYNNEPIVVLHARDSALIDPIALVAVDQMRRIGLNIDLQSTDWSTVAQRRTNRTGWNVVPLVWNGFDMPEPMVNPAFVYNCANVYPGWWCDERQVPLLRAYSEEPDATRRRELATRLQVLAHEHVNVVLLGQFAGPGVYRADLRGVIDAGFPVLWNIRRERR